MKTILLGISMMLLCAVGTRTVYAQCTTSPLSVNERIAKARFIVIGEVTDKHCYAGNDGNIYTLNTINIKAWAKNNQRDAAIYVITYGGILNGQAQVTTPSLQLAMHERYLLLLEDDNAVLDDKAARAATPLVKQAFAYADAQGAMLYQDNVYFDAPTAKKMDERTLLQTIYAATKESAKTPGGDAYAGEQHATSDEASLVPTITSFSPNPTNAGTIVSSDFLTIKGSGFGTTRPKVEFKNADNGGSNYVTVINSVTDYISYNDNTIVVKVPDNAGTGTIRVNGKTSSQVLTINYAHESVNNLFNGFTDSTRQRYYLRNIVDTAGYIFKYNTTSGFSTNTAAIAAFERAMNTWRCKTGINWLVNGITQKGNASDKENVVEFDGTLPAGTLGTTTYRLSASSNKDCNKENTVWFLAEVDMRFAPVPATGYTWQFGPQQPTNRQYDFESVTLHELGHAHGLAHRIAQGQTMNYSISNGVAIRTPSDVELNGALNKMSYSTVPTCFNPPGSGLPMTKASCVLPVSLIAFTAQLQSQQVALSWQTASETNTAYFTIERSANGTDFTPVAKVNAAGNSAVGNDYHYADNVSGLAGGTLFYRLKETDRNGQSLTSGTATVTIIGKQFMVYPNPAKTFIKISGQNIALVQVYDIAGKLLIKKTVQGETVTTVNTALLSKGIYTLVIKDTNGNTDTRKLVIE